jgi:hypothetical protein
MEEYKYDVAFSFHSNDEKIAVALNEILTERVRTFIYTEKQKELVGNDGMDTFSAVFNKEAQYVVVFYRSEWGNTKWTRIEETAIKNRGYDEGFGFCIFLPTVKGVSLPDWLPKTNIYLDLDRFGIDKAAAIIEYKLQETGVVAKSETPVDRAKRLKERMDAESKKRKLFASSQGVQLAWNELQNLFKNLEKLSIVIDKSAKINLRCSKSLNTYPYSPINWFDIRGPNAGLSVEWKVKYENTLDAAVLITSFMDKIMSRNGRDIFDYDKPKTLEKINFNFDMDLAGEYGWRYGRDEDFLSSEKLAELVIKKLMDHIHNRHMKSY